MGESKDEYQQNGERKDEEKRSDRQRRSDFFPHLWIPDKEGAQLEGANGTY